MFRETGAGEASRTEIFSVERRLFDWCQSKDLSEFCCGVEVAIAQRLAHIIQLQSIFDREMWRPRIVSFDQFNRNLRDEVTFVDQFGFMLSSHSLALKSSRGETGRGLNGFKRKLIPFGLIDA